VKKNGRLSWDTLMFISLVLSFPLFLSGVTAGEDGGKSGEGREEKSVNRVFGWEREEREVKT